jgi:hypothetical protein
MSEIAKNKPGFRITEVFIYASVDRDGDEGVIGFRNGMVWMPAVMADRARLRSMKAQVDAMRAAGINIRLLRLSVREDLSAADETRLCESDA